MSKASGYAILLAVALSLMAVSCTGPVIFKSPVAGTNTTSPSATAQGVGSAPKSTVADAAKASGTIAAATTMPAMPTTDAATQTAATDPVAVAALPSPWDGAGVFAAAFVGVLLITISLLNYLFRAKSPENKQG